MSNEYWLKQDNQKPLFPDILWSRPENKRFAGKLLIIGGNSNGFSDVASCYNLAIEAGVGEVHVALPDRLEKTLSKLLPGGEYLLSNPSGGFSKMALSEFLSLSSWSDGVLISGDLGKNSETAVLLDSYVQKYVGPLAITNDGVDYFITNCDYLLTRPDSLLVLSLAELQKLAISSKFDRAFKQEINLVNLVELLSLYTKQHFKLSLITVHSNYILIANNGFIVTQAYKDLSSNWANKVSSRSIVFWIQNINKQLEAIASSIIS